MATAEINYGEEYDEIRTRAGRIMNLLKARCYIASLRGIAMPKDALHRLEDTLLKLLLLKKNTEYILDLSSCKKLTKEQLGNLKTQQAQWLTRKEVIEGDVMHLEYQSNDFKSKSLPPTSSIFAILEDLQKATEVMIEKSKERSGRNLAKETMANVKQSS